MTLTIHPRMATRSRVESAADATAILLGVSLPRAIAHLESLGGVHVSATVQNEISAAYMALPEFAFDDARIYAAWRAFENETLAQWAVLESLGFSMRVVDSNPYENAAELFEDVARKHIDVLSTAETGGHPLLSNYSNDVFRAVHDILGHSATGRGFDRHGEEAAYLAHSAIYSPMARMALATETRGQNAALISTGEFQVQKVAILPEWMRGVRRLSSWLDNSEELQADAIIRHIKGGLL
jgi:hypothetical protein